LIANAMKKARG